MGAFRNPSVEPVGAWRRWLVVAVLGAGALTVLARAAQLQVVERDVLVERGDRRALRTLRIQAHRGAVLDRNGEPLALSAPADSIWAVPSKLLEASAYHEPIARLLNISPAELRERLAERPDAQFIYLRRLLSPDVADRVLALGAPGVSRENGFRRYYPAGEVAAHVVGFTGSDGDGLEGMEAAADEVLRGTSGSRRVVRSRDGRIVDDSLGTVPAVPGTDVRLTLDLRLQYATYRELKRTVEQHGAASGVVIIADPWSGEILAAVSQPGYNPNKLSDRRSAAVRNRVVTDQFEPGSSIKPLLVAGALADGGYRADDVIDTQPGLIKVSGHRIQDRRAFGRVDLSELLAVSSNVAAAKIGLDLGPERLHDTYERFGLGARVGSGFPGEVTGVLRVARRWRELDTASAAFGYGVSVTALHLLRAYCALANGGELVSLTWVRDEQRAVPRARVLPRGVSRTVRELMRGVVSNHGTAGRAAVPGYSVAGKTGTVRKTVDGKYDENAHQAIFSGILPASRPRLVILVMVDEPSGEAHSGGQIAAPLFARVARTAARILAIPPDQPSAPLLSGSVSMGPST